MVPDGAPADLGAGFRPMVPDAERASIQGFLVSPGRCGGCL